MPGGSTNSGPLSGAGGATTGDVYNPGNSPPAAPDSAGVGLTLIEDYRNGLEAGVLEVREAA